MASELSTNAANGGGRPGDGPGLPTGHRQYVKEDLQDLAAKPLAQLIVNDKHGKWSYDMLQMSRLPKKEVMIKVFLNA
ncbi:hypothetical protein M422DRAFT_245879 [Sphaerobolus stellatus SS14]|nr:hypothetical protein M422DRAFT_245879 [Sphaerobolus stellatus SS14]